MGSRLHFFAPEAALIPFGVRIFARSPLTSRIARLAVLSILLSAVAVSAGGAGTVCGTVRDGDTHQPVARAGIFVRTTSGAYTGFHAASDASGAFCIDGIPAGTYDLEVRVDEYLAGYFKNVVVSDDVTGVVDAVLTGFALAPPWPNPARDFVSLRFHAPPGRPVTVEVVDAAGRIVKGWRAASTSSREQSFTWNLRDDANRPIPAGLYFVRLKSNPSKEVRSFIRVR